MTAHEITTFPCIIRRYCRVRLAPALPPQDVSRIEKFLLRRFAAREIPPRAGGGWSWHKIAEECGIAAPDLSVIGALVEPILRQLKRQIETSPTMKTPEKGAIRKPRAKNNGQNNRSPNPTTRSTKTGRGKPGPKPMVPVEHPKALWDVWDDPEEFHEALSLHMKRHGDTSYRLRAAICARPDDLHRTTISSWRRGLKSPMTVESLQYLSRIEKRYNLPPGYFKAKLPCPSRAVRGQAVPGISRSERRRLAWHLPDDFDERPLSERQEIVAWIREKIVSGATEYRRFQAAAMKNRYGVMLRPNNTAHILQNAGEVDEQDEEVDDNFGAEIRCSAISAPRALAAEVEELIRFKTSTLTSLGYQRNGVWGTETTAQQLEHLGLLFGALSAHPKSPARGYGVPREHLSMSLLLFPAVWDWYVQWRERRRGFYTSWETNMLQIAAALTREETGWLRQTPQLMNRLIPIAGLVSAADITRAKENWGEANAIMHKHARTRVKEIERVLRVHRDPFEPILPVLEADSPILEYRKIVDEIIRYMPNEHRYPIAAAESVRSILMLRIGLHTGLRQKNLRQLLVCRKDRVPTSERELTDRRTGELRWSYRTNTWEIFIPTSAFKNARSSFFSNNPYRLHLPDVGNLYSFLEDYLDRHRVRLLRNATDPGTLFVKTVKISSSDAVYDQNTFYEAWRWIIQRYGVYNPYTKRGAIEGLLPHGPHNIRDVLATHVLKKTGSYEQASYAIQDTPEVVAKHYGRFLPQDKAALVAHVINKVWEAG
jgi:hypothetical protein